MSEAAGWTVYLDRIDTACERAAAALLDGDLDGAAAALAVVDGAGAAARLPRLAPELAARARQTLEHLGATERAVAGALRRLRPELALVTGAVAGTRREPLFHDHSA